MLKVKKLYVNAVVPTRATEGSAGLDLYVHHWSYELNCLVVHTGLSIEIPPGLVGLIFPRSSIGSQGFRLLNTCGIIDSDYRGEILLKFNPINDNKLIFVDCISVGSKVAQLLIVPISVEDVIEVDVLSETSRGTGGFGSTGK